MCGERKVVRSSRPLLTGRAPSVSRRRRHTSLLLKKTSPLTLPSSARPNCTWKLKSAAQAVTGWTKSSKHRHKANTYRTASTSVDATMPQTAEIMRAILSENQDYMLLIAATAWAAIPSRRPVKPNPSVVVALIFTCPVSMARAPAMVRFICGI